LEAGDGAPPAAGGIAAPREILCRDA